MLETQTLWFTRADQFEDPLEGGYTDAELARFKSNPATPRRFASLQPHEDLPRKTRMTTYINCWRRGSAESLAMWSLYGSNAGTVAVKTTVGQLRNAVATSAESLFLAEVSYVDWNHLTDVEDGISLCTRKELSYSHEAEVRLLMLASVDDVFASFGTPPSCIPAFHESYLARTLCR
jgi:hypothetical protein